jgi:hypothetical protein
MTQSQLFHVAPPASKGFEASAHIGSSVIIATHRRESGVQTEYGVKNVVNVDIIVVAGPMKGEIYSNVTLFNVQLVQQLTGLVGEVTLGRLGLGGSKNKAVILLAPVEEDHAAAAAWMDAHPGVIVEMQRVGKLLAEQPRQQAQPAPQAQQQQPQPAYSQQVGWNQPASPPPPVTNGLQRPPF